MSTTQLTALQQAIVTIKDLRARLDQASEPIAIVGIGCRFPGGVDGPATLWTLLSEGVDPLGDVPVDRWPLDELYDASPDTPGKMYMRQGGFLEDVARFDAGFFRITPREASMLDPQQRILLEVAWEALENAGQVPAALLGTRTGVFVGSAVNSYLDRLGGSERAEMDPYAISGNLPCTLSGRLSYVLGVRGPNMQLDTGCSSSLVALHLAVQSVRSGESDLAIAAGVNVIASPHLSVGLCRMNALAPDGRCKTFDARADGYARSDGCAVVVLKRLSAAIGAGDRIWAVVRGTATNHDGASAGLTVPSGPAQEELLRAALANARVDAREVAFVETHGTGTELGDPIEVGALARVYGAAARRPMRLGALKSNIGHTEPAAGLAGVIKTALCLRHGQIPPNLHFQSPNPKIELDRTPFGVPTTLEDWPAGYEKRLGAVSSFGLGGTNAHAVLEAFPVPPVAKAEDDGTPVLLPLSARDPNALRALAERYRALLAGDDAPALADVARAASLERMHHPLRATVTARTRADAMGALAALAAGETRDVLAEGRATGASRVVFVFPGQGSQWLGMGRQLLIADPSFAEAFGARDEVIARHAGFSVLAELAASPETSRLGEVDIVQPVLFAMQVALSAALGKLGVRPHVVVGHSMGEVAAAHCAGILSLDDAARIITTRSRLAREHASGKGAMAVVELSPEEADRRVAPHRAHLSIAVINGPSSVVLSGESQALDALLATLEGEGVWFRRVKVDYASHSPEMDALLPGLRARLSDVAPRAGSVRMRSTVTGTEVEGETLDAAYWARNLREPVRFGEAIQALAKDGVHVFVELSPHPVLVQAIADNVRHVGSTAVAVPTLRREADEPLALLTAIGALHCHGAPVDWRRLHGERRRHVELPTYAWQHVRYWIDYESPVSATRVRDGVGEEEPVEAAEAPILVRMNAAPLAAKEALLGVHVREVVRRAFRLPRDHALGDDQDLFDLGMDSMLAVELARRFSADLGTTVPTASIFAQPTIGALTKALLASVEQPTRPVAAPVAGTRSPWFVVHTPRPAARLRLICFPYAGGGTGVFRGWGTALPEDVEVVAIRAPGRESRAHEAPFDSVTDLVDDLMPRLDPILDRPYALLGYSLGALVAFEVAQRLRWTRERQPRALVVMGAPAPHRLNPVPDDALSDEKLLHFLEDGGVVSAEVLADDGMKVSILRLMRADGRMYQTYRASTRQLLECPIVAYGAEDDSIAPPSLVKAWEECTVARFLQRPMPGRHFFVHSHADLLLAMLGRDVSEWQVDPRERVGRESEPVRAAS
jgi:acyl transferase domain-containing protein/surfactin synthase thioesterase subunit